MDTNIYFCDKCLIVGIYSACPRCKKEGAKLTEKQKEQYVQKGYRVLVAKV